MTPDEAVAELDSKWGAVRVAGLGDKGGTLDFGTETEAIVAVNVAMIAYWDSANWLAVRRKLYPGLG